MSFPLRLLAGLISFCLLPGIASAADDDVQFDPGVLKARGVDAATADWFSKAPRFMPGKATVALSVNGNPKGTVTARFDADGQPCVSEDLLRQAGLKTPSGWTPEATCLPLKQAWPQADITADPGMNRLEVVVPQQALRDDADLSQWQHGGVAGMLNYNAQTSGSAGGGSRVRFNQLGTEAGFNAGDWIVRSQQTFTRFDGTTTTDFQTAYAQRTLESVGSVFQAGQVSLAGSLFSTGQVLGAQLFPESALQDTRGGVGQVSGIADTQSVVQVRQSGVLIYSTTVPAGPWHLKNLPLLNTRSDLLVTLTDTGGAVKTYTVPASSLLINGNAQAPGLSAGVGKLDQSGSDLSPWLGTVATGWQLSPGTVLGAGLLGSAPYRAAATTLDAQPLPATMLSLQATGAQDAQHGNRGLNGTATVSWQPVEKLSLSVNYSQQSAGYRELSDAVQYDSTDISGLNHRQAGVGVSWSLPALGALSLTWSRNTPFSGSPYSYVSAGWSRQVGTATLGLSWQHNAAVSNTDDSGNTTTTASDDRVYATLSIPFGRRSLSSYVSSSTRNGDRGGLRYNSRSDQNSGWSLGADRDSSGNDTTITGSGDLTTRSSQLSGSLTRDGDTTSWSAGATGGVAFHQNGVTLSPYRIEDTFGIAKVGDEAGVKIDTPSGPVWTDSRGYAVLPSLGAYQKTSVQVDTRSLKKNTDLGNAWQETDLARGGVSRVNFGVVSTRRLLATVTGADGKPLPHAASVFDAEGNFITVAGDGGEVFVQDAKPGATLEVQQSGKTLCRFSLAIPEKPDPDQTGLFETTTATCR